MSSGFWLDERVRAVPERSRYTFLRLLTDPSMTSVGAMRATVPGLAAELGWSVDRLRLTLAPLVERGMVEVNASANYIGLPKFLKHNPPESPNVVRAWVKALRNEVPDCPEKYALVGRCREYLAAREVSGELKPGFRKAFEEAFARDFGEAFAQGSANPDTGAGGTTPEQEQEVSLSGNGAKPSGKTSRKHVSAAWGTQ